MFFIDAFVFVVEQPDKSEQEPSNLESFFSMKILVISNCPLEESQGSGYVIINFCRGLSERRHEVDLFGPQS